jgi:hypothetical protein
MREEISRVPFLWWGLDGEAAPNKKIRSVFRCVVPGCPYVAAELHKIVHRCERCRRVLPRDTGQGVDIQRICGQCRILKLRRARSRHL